MKIQVEWDDPAWVNLMRMMPINGWEVIEDDLNWGTVLIKEQMWINAIILTNPDWILDSDQ